MNKFRRNIRLDYIHTLFRNFNLTHGIWLIYLASKGFSFFEIGLFEGIFHLSSITMEVPTGMIADILGRKISRVLGVVTFILYILLLLIGNSFFVIGIAFFLCGLAYTFESGSGEALVYDSLILINEEQRYMKVMGYKEILFQLSNSIALVVGGYLAIRAMEWNFYLMFLVFAIALVPILMMRETMEKRNIEKHDFRSEMYNQFIKSTKTVFSSKHLMFLLISGALMAAPITTLFFYLQNHLTNLEYSFIAIGWLLGVHSVVSSLGGLFAQRIEKIFREKLIIYIIPIFIVALIWLVQIESLVFISFSLLGFFDAVLYIVLNDYINRVIPSDQRATILSFGSLAFSIVMILIFPLVGFLGDTYGLPVGFLALAIIVSLSYLGLLLSLRGNNIFKEFS